MRKGDNGIEVVKLQRAVLELGYALPRWGDDGDLGAETFGAMARLFRDHGRKFDEDGGLVTDDDLAFVYALARELATITAPVSTEIFFDLRRDADRHCVMHRREWSSVTGICLHQTACNLGERPKRWTTVGAHMGVTREGKVVWLYDFNVAIVHGHGFNTHTIGIEMDGEYSGVGGNIHTFWRPKDEPNRQPQTPTNELIDSAKKTVRWICTEVARRGGKVSNLFAHRQANTERQSDPGSELWKAVSLPLQDELGLSDGGDGYKIDSGYAIPESWDPRRAGVKY